MEAVEWLVGNLLQLPVTSWQLKQRESMTEGAARTLLDAVWNDPLPTRGADREQVSVKPVTRPICWINGSLTHMGTETTKEQRTRGH